MIKFSPITGDLSATLALLAVPRLKLGGPTPQPGAQQAEQPPTRKGPVGQGASLMKVFMPYLVWNTVFDNTRVTSELGRKPVPFSQYSFPLLKFSRENNFEYPYQPWPAARGGTAA